MFYNGKAVATKLFCDSLNCSFLYSVQIPRIKKQPSNKEDVTPEENVQFVVEGTGMKLSYTWHHQTSKDASKVKVGGNNPTLHIDKVKSGYYTCTISNPAGGTIETNPAQLTTGM